jgi:alpha-ketoglutarate-dependent taurine dioxygenase
MKDLVARATRPKDIHTHEWDAHELIIRDNRCTLHGGLPWEKSRYRPDHAPHHSGGRRTHRHRRLSDLNIRKF